MFVCTFVHVNASSRFFTLPKLVKLQCTISQKQLFSIIVKCKDAFTHACMHMSMILGIYRVPLGMAQDATYSFCHTYSHGLYDKRILIQSTLRVYGILCKRAVII